MDIGRQASRASPAQRDTKQFERIEKLAREIIDAFQDHEPLLVVMALRLAAQRIYDTRCRKKHDSEAVDE